MFRDTREELHRLEQALLERDEDEAGEDVLSPEAESDFPVGRDTMVFPGLSPAEEDIPAYNSDRLDRDPEALSRELEQGPTTSVPAPLLALAAVLMTAIVVTVLMLYLKLRGVL